MMWFGTGGWWMGLWMMAFWVGVVLLVVWGVRALADTSSSPPRNRGERSASRILEERFARGEIDRQEFEQRRAALEDR